MEEKKGIVRAARRDEGKAGGGITRKCFLKLNPPTEEENASAQQRILKALLPLGLKNVSMTARVMRALYPLCDESGWEVTVSLAYDGRGWVMTDLEPGDTSREHYGLAVDLGSTTVVMQMVDCTTGNVIAQKSIESGQIAFGDDILTRIFYSKDRPDHLEEIRLATVSTLLSLMDALSKETGIDAKTCISMTVAGNTAMIHFLIGMDAFCVFASPYALRADRPGFLRARDLGIPLPGFVYCFPGKANYLGGDIVSGMIACSLHCRDDIALFFDVGTNGELVVGNRDFLLCGAGAAGPALEGGVVRTGMRAAPGAVEHLKLREGGFDLQIIGGTKEAKGICGSGIVDLISELFLNGWLDLRGKLVPEASEKIVWKEKEYAVNYAPDLWFYQSDINEFILTKAAAYTMMDYLLEESGIRLEDVSDFYMAGAFGTHVDKESAVNIGMYPDVSPEKIHSEGNTSLKGARMLLLDASLLDEIDRILELMTYVQFGAVEDFLEKMVAASALPHTDLERYPSVRARLERHGLHPFS